MSEIIGSIGRISSKFGQKLLQYIKIAATKTQTLLYGLSDRIPYSFKERIGSVWEDCLIKLTTGIKYDLYTLRKLRSKALPYWKFKIAFSLLGLIFFGVFGLVAGFIIGHIVDIYLNPQQFLIFSIKNAANPLQTAFSSKQAAMKSFTRSVLGLLAATAQKDGQVNKKETETLRDLFEVEDKDFATLSALFKASCQRTKTTQNDYILQLNALFPEDNAAVYTYIIGSLFVMAEADGFINKAEYLFISETATSMGLSAKAFDKIAQKYQIKCKDSSGASIKKLTDFEVLGLSRNASKSEVRRRWLNLVRENHPDKLIALGASAYEIEEANEKIATINAAYEHIMECLKNKTAS